MIVRLMLTLGLVLSGTGAPPLAAAVSSPVEPAVLRVSVPQPVPTQDPAGSADDATVTQLDVVVPAVERDGDVVVPDAQSAPADGVVVADHVVADERLESPVVETGGFQTLGVTWPGDAEVDDLGVQVRTRSDGEWSGWVPLEEGDEAPDAGTPDARTAVRGGTDPLWVGEADAVQLSFAATDAGGPGDMSLALVDSPEVQAEPTDAIVGEADGEASIITAAWAADATATLLAPHIITRAEWQARPQVCSPDVATTLVGAVVHHTAGSNTYSTVAQAMQQIRGDQAYHIDGRGWCDIGYNFIVDKWGNVYEGRANSSTEPVIGVHAGGFNTGTVGVSMLGNYSDVAPSPQMQESVARVIGWRLSAYGRNPSGAMTYYTFGGENSRYPAGTTVNLPVVFGHRDVAYTACPGNVGYTTLGGVRDRATKIAYSEPIVRALYHDMLKRDVDAKGLQTWTAALMAGIPASALADVLSRSQEYVQRRVVDGYLEVLHRGPDPTGFATWTQAISSGRLRAEDLRGELIASVEYYNSAGGTDAAYIAQLYRDILHREAGASEIASWAARIAVAGRGAAPYGVWRSLESAQLRVHETYQTYLDRQADVNGLATWGPYWQANGEDAVRMQVVGSDEYLARSIRRFL